MNKKVVALSVMVVALSFIIPFSYAIFRSVASINGSLAVAEWDVELIDSGDNNHLSIISGDTSSSASYRITITSASQVDVIYSIVVDGVPEGTNVTLDGTTTLASSNDKAIFSEIGTINYSDTNKTKTHTLTFTADENTESVEDEEININVIARQVLAS